jgi:alpha-glucosidase (family GH31 glycosyl hydrolase)
MCGRWIQLATFYPFARAHQNLTYYGSESDRSEPYTLNEPYLSMARDSIFDRYQYLRHLYTCLFEASQSGGSCFDPLFYYYPEDDKAFENVEASFIVGGALKVSPVLQPNMATYESYFPAGAWVSLRDFSIINNTVGQMVNLTAANTVQVHLKEGSLIPF